MQISWDVTVKTFKRTLSNKRNFQYFHGAFNGLNKNFYVTFAFVYDCTFTKRLFNILLHILEL